jgi:Tfp pilus assembly protein PilX
MTRLRDDRGSALIIAMVVMGLLLTASLATLQFIDASQKRSGRERIRETAFNYAEALLDGEVLMLTKTWPSTPATAAPANCTAAGTLCPDPTQVKANFAGIDMAAASSWRTQVRDNIGVLTSFYDKTAADTTACGAVSPCTWDSNQDGAMWVRVDATVRGKTRSLVALAKQGETRVPLPRNTITAGWFKTTNNGNKTIVDEKGCQAKHKPSNTCNATDPAPIVVRGTTTAPSPNDACLGYRKAQVTPESTTTGYVGNVIPAFYLDQMKTQALATGAYPGTYFDASRGCPTTAQLAGPLVFIDGISCTYSSGDINSSTTPGFLVVNQASITITATANYYGVIYAANNLTPPADAGALVTVSGGGYVQGAIFVEGNGGASIGGSGLNVSFDPNALGNITVLGMPGVVHNSYRELLAGQ